MADGISIGDAVLTFFGDTKPLDAAYAKVQQGATQTAGVVTETQAVAGKAFQQTGEQVEQLTHEMAVGQQGAVELGTVMELSGEKVRASMYEARGEIGLLGEAVGVQLPRHVRSFVAELPGVSSALSAAFSITAVGFLITALIEVSEKMSEFAASVIYGTEAAKEHLAAQVEVNKVMLTLSEQYKAAKQQVDDYGKSVLDLAQDKLAKAVKASNEAKDAVKEQTAAVAALKKETEDYAKSQAEITYWQSIKNEAGVYVDALKGLVTGQLTFSQAIDKMADTSGLAAESIAKLNEKTLELGTSQKDAKVKTEDLALAEKQYMTALTETYLANLKREQSEDAALAKQAQGITAAILAYREMGFAVAGNADNIDQLVIKMPEAAAGFLKIGSAMQAVGIDTVALRSQLLSQSSAVDTLYAAYQKGQVGLRTFQQAELAEVQTQRELAVAQGQNTKALDAHIAALQRSLGIDNQKAHSYQRLTALDRQFTQELHQSGSVSQAVWNTSASAMGSAVYAYATGAATMGQALAKIAQDEIASLSERAAIKAIEQLGYGFATMWTNPPESSAHFQSAAIFGSLAIGGAIAGRALSGAAGGGSSAGSSTSGGGANAGITTSAATQSGPIQVSVTNVQRFGSGALVSQPTLAIVGDNKSGGAGREAIVPLDDPTAMAKLGGVAGGPQIHVHVAGLISPDNLNKVIKNISKRVNNGTSHLVSSNTHRVTRRSQ